MENNYRLSVYDHFLVVGNTVIGVNFINKVLFAIDIEKYELLLANKENLGALKKQNPAFYSAMRKLGIIASEESDKAFYENSLLERRLIVFRDPHYRLTINPTLNCNFSCWYCYETHNNKHMSKEIHQKILKFIKNTIKRPDIHRFELDWFGGEPLLCYQNILKPITEFTKKVCEEENVSFMSGMTTNGYYLNKDMIPFFKETNMQSFQITLDGPKDVHNKIRHTHANVGSYDTIVQNIVLLARELTPSDLLLRINYTSETFDKIESIIDSFPFDVRPNITVILQQVWQDKDTNQVTAKISGDLLFKFQNAGFKVEKEILHCSLECTCYADCLNQAVVNYDGRVFKCTALNFEKTKEDGILTEDGDILWGSSLSHKLVRATFENENCRDCNFLPICFGPCHKKTTYVLDGDDFKKYCFKEGIEDTLNYIMTEFEKTKQPLAPLLEFRK